MKSYVVWYNMDAECVLSEYIKGEAMRKIISIVVLLIALSSPAFAEDGGDDDLSNPCPNCIIQIEDGGDDD